jgi:hypothetical protein
MKVDVGSLMFIKSCMRCEAFNLQNTNCWWNKVGEDTCQHSTIIQYCIQNLNNDSKIVIIYKVHLNI